LISFTLGSSSFLVFLVIDLKLSLLKLIVLKVEKLFESEILLRIAVSCVGIKDFRKFCLTNNSVLNFSKSFIGENNMALVNTKFERQE